PGGRRRLGQGKIRVRRRYRGCHFIDGDGDVGHDDAGGAGAAEGVVLERDADVVVTFFGVHGVRRHAEGQGTGVVRDAAGGRAVAGERDIGAPVAPVDNSLILVGRGVAARQFSQGGILEGDEDRGGGAQVLAFAGGEGSVRGDVVDRDLVDRHADVLRRGLDEA